MEQQKYNKIVDAISSTSYLLLLMYILPITE